MNPQAMFYETMNFLLWPVRFVMGIIKSSFIIFVLSFVMPFLYLLLVVYSVVAGVLTGTGFHHQYFDVLNLDPNAHWYALIPVLFFWVVLVPLGLLLRGICRFLFGVPYTEKQLAKHLAKKQAKADARWERDCKRQARFWSDPDKRNRRARELRRLRNKLRTT